MSTIVTRVGKGTPLTNVELDTNFTNLDSDKLESTDGTFTGTLSLQGNISSSFTAGEDLTIGQLCYLSPDGKMWQVDASTEAATTGQLGIVADGLLADETGSFILYGKVAGYLGLSIGNAYYISESAGLFTDTQPTTFIRLIGFAINTTTIFLSPSPDWIEV